VGLSPPMCTRFLIDSDGVHKCDHTRGIDTKQLDDGIDHTFVSAGGSETICVRLFSLSFVHLDVCYVVVDPALENRYQSTMDTDLRGGSCFSGN